MTCMYVRGFLFKSKVSFLSFSFLIFVIASKQEKAQIHCFVVVVSLSLRVEEQGTVTFCTRINTPQSCMVAPFYYVLDKTSCDHQCSNTNYILCLQTRRDEIVFGTALRNFLHKNQKVG